MTKVWTYPGDTLSDKLVRLMLTYRQALQDRDAPACQLIDTIAKQDPQTAAKLPDQAPLHMDDLMSDKDVAVLIGVAESTVRKWASRGLIKRHTHDDGSTAFLVAEVVEMMRSRRLRAAGTVISDD